METTLTKTRIRAGVWEGVLSGSAAQPVLDVLHLEQPLEGVTIAAVPDREGDWLVRVPIPSRRCRKGCRPSSSATAPPGRSCSISP